MVIPGAVPKALTRDARARVEGLRARGGTDSGSGGLQATQFFAQSPECQQGYVNMLEGTNLGGCLRELIGPFSPVIACDSHNTPAVDDGGLGGDQGEMGHIDGQHGSAALVLPYPQTLDDIRAAGKDPNDAEAMHNYMSHLDHRAPVETLDGVHYFTPLWHDPERTLTLGAFTAFVVRSPQPCSTCNSTGGPCERVSVLWSAGDRVLRSDRDGVRADRRPSWVPPRLGAVLPDAACCRRAARLRRPR